MCDRTTPSFPQFVLQLPQEKDGTVKVTFSPSNIWKYGRQTQDMVVAVSYAICLIPATQ